MAVQILLALVYALFLWWFSTGVIFWLNGLPQASFRWSMLGATGVLAASVWGMVASAESENVAGAYAAFSCALLIWGWQTMSYYMGFVTGPRCRPCPSDASGGRRFFYGVAASIYHELLVLASAILLIALTWGAPNQIGTWTFIALWLMHLSAKLNLFFGVRNLQEEFLPPHLDYLRSFFRRRSMNPLFPISVTLGTVISALLFEAALAVEATTFVTAGYALVATLIALAVLEHWFLILPIPAAALWHWSLHERHKDEPQAPQKPLPHRRRMVGASTPSTAAPPAGLRDGESV